MPLHVQPILRAREEAMEQEGLIQTRDTALTTIFKAQEAGGQRTKVVPKQVNVFRNTRYTPS